MMAARGAEEAADTMASLRDRFEMLLCETLTPRPTILGCGASRLPNTSLLTLPIRLPSSFSQATADLIMSRPRCAHLKTG
ncbi:MAG: hypothetical protein R3C05_15680 [Pirellulaceae bacterium]